jgi:hypothetical protein
MISFLPVPEEILLIQVNKLFTTRNTITQSILRQITRRVVNTRTSNITGPIIRLPPH